jgi:hypothetical protein
MIRMATLRDMGGYRKQFRVGQDRDLWLRLSERGMLVNLPEYLYLWRRNPEAISELRRPEQRKMSDFALELAIQRLRDGVDDLGGKAMPAADNKLLARHRFYLGFGLLSRRRFMLAVRLMVGALWADGSDPSRWYSLVMGAPLRILRNTRQSFLMWLARVIRGTARGQSSGVKLPAPKREQ